MASGSTQRTLLHPSDFPVYLVKVNEDLFFRLSFQDSNPVVKLYLSQDLYWIEAFERQLSLQFFLQMMEVFKNPYQNVLESTKTVFGKYITEIISLKIGI